MTKEFNLTVYSHQLKGSSSWASSSVCHNTPASCRVLAPSRGLLLCAFSFPGCVETKRGCIERAPSNKKKRENLQWALRAFDLVCAQVGQAAKEREPYGRGKSEYLSEPCCGVRGGFGIRDHLPWRRNFGPSMKDDKTARKSSIMWVRVQKYKNKPQSPVCFFIWIQLFFHTRKLHALAYL